ncbi:putative nucleotide-sugar transporter YMD8 [Candida viswanathii]|uniref:GDP-mannose transporter n=1 Tax=Candida viswanathii TaxID=5486 RepID=A0A367YKS4_9ASCO|nr:putative nucleotide-sugar transporter YMD8 [Candida viswanathii]
MSRINSEESSGASTRESFEIEEPPLDQQGSSMVFPAANKTNYQSKTLESVIYISGWYFFSLSIFIYNKWMFGSGLDFKFPIIITSFHQLCLFILSSLLLYFNPGLRPSHSSSIPIRGLKNFFASLLMDSTVYFKQIFPCSMASAGDIGLSNVSISLITLSLYTMLKTSSLMFVLIFGLLFKLEKFNGD